MDWQNITSQDILLLGIFIVIYPIYWISVYAFLDDIFD